MTLVSFVLGLPLILLVSSSLLFATGMTFKRKRHNHLCHKGVLSIQRLQAQSLNRLLGLNPLARKLRAQRRRADSALKKAMKTRHPSVIAAAQAYRAQVMVQQALAPRNYRRPRREQFSRQPSIKENSRE